MYSKALADHNSQLDAATTLIDRYEVARRLGVSISTLSKLLKSGRFPQPVRITYGTYGWRLIDVDRGIKALMHAKWLPRPIIGRAKQLVERKEGLLTERARL